MTPNVKTSISVKADTRKRIKSIAETKSMDYNDLINWMMDELNFPTWEEILNSITQKNPALVVGGN